MGSPLRILHVVVNMNRGGAETLIMNLYRNIDRAKVQFDFLTCKEGVFDSEIVKMGGIVHRIPYISDVGHFRYKKELNNFFIANNQYKVVHSHMDKMTGLVLRAAKHAGISIRISHSHNTSSEGGFGARVYKWYIGNLIFSNATNLLACSQSAAHWLFKWKAREAKILKNGIDLNQFTFNQQIRNEVRGELQLTNKFVLGHVGRFTHQKNHSFLIDVFEKFSKVNNNAVLVLVGDGPLRFEIEKKVQTFNLVDKVKFVGIRSDINRILQAFDVFVFPSFHEGLPVSLIEAQCAGLPCLLSDKISQEVDLGCNLVDFLPPINETRWVQKLKYIEPLRFNRGIVTKSISKNGYNIKETAGNIENFYLSISG